MADTVASLSAEIAALEAAWRSALAIGTSTALPTGVSHAPQDPTKLDAMIRARKARLARLQAIEAGRSPFPGVV